MNISCFSSHIAKKSDLKKKKSRRTYVDEPCLYIHIHIYTVIPVSNQEMAPLFNQCSGLSVSETTVGGKQGKLPNINFGTLKNAFDMLKRFVSLLMSRSTANE